MEFSELLDHLDDLIALARAERFNAFANELTSARWLMAKQVELFAVRASSPATTEPPRCCAMSNDSRFKCELPAGHDGMHAASDPAGGAVGWATFKPPVGTIPRRV